MPGHNNTGNHHLKNTKSFLANALINSVNFTKKYADGTNNCMIIGDFNYHWNKEIDTNHEVRRERHYKVYTKTSA